MMTAIQTWVEWVTLGVIPWWLYIAGGLAACVFIVTALPGRLGLALGLLAAMVLQAFGWSAHGYSLGASANEAKWQGYVAAEKSRLTAAFNAGAVSEATRATQAQEQQEHLKGATDEISKEADGLPDSTAVVVPESVARKLYDLRGRR